MKPLPNILMSVFMSIFLTNVAHATDFKLSPSPDNYISLNECLYAFSKGIKLETTSPDIYLYKNEIWSIAYKEEDQKISCERVGKLSE